MEIRSLPKVLLFIQAEDRASHGAAGEWFTFKTWTYGNSRRHQAALTLHTMQSEEMTGGSVLESTTGINNVK